MNFQNWPLRLAAAALALLALHFVGQILHATINDYVFDIIMLAGINIILAVSLNLVNGVTGQFSLGHAGLMAVGAYSAAAFTFYAGPRLALPPTLIFALSLVVAAAMAGLAGLLIGLPSLRLRGDYLAIVTLGFGQIIIAIIVTVKELGGALGMTDAPPRADGSMDMAFRAAIQTNFLWLFGMAALCVLSMRNLAVSNLGRAMKAIREDEIAAEASGVNTTQVKVLSFVFSALWAGVAGGLYAHYNHSITPADYDFVRSVQIVVMVVLGGLGSITGAAVAAVLLTVMDNLLRTVVGTYWVGFALIGLSGVLAFPKIKTAVKLARWIGPLLISLGVLALLMGPGRRFIESPDTPGNSADWLRYVVYALILIFLMLLRPQGLLGRWEVSWGKKPPPPGPTSAPNSSDELPDNAAQTFAAQTP